LWAQIEAHLQIALEKAVSEGSPEKMMIDLMLKPEIALDMFNKQAPADSI
jgi:hypothetical protein